MTSNTTTSKASGASWKQLISTLLLILLVVGVALAAAITLEVTAGWMRNPQNAVAIVFTGTIIGELAAFGLLVWQLHRRGQTLRDIGWGQPTR